MCNLTDRLTGGGGGIILNRVCWPKRLHIEIYSSTFPTGYFGSEIMAAIFMSYKEQVTVFKPFSKRSMKIKAIYKIHNFS